MEYYGHAFRHQLQEMPLRASRVRLQTTLQIPEIKDMSNFIRDSELKAKVGKDYDYHVGS